MVTTSPNPYYNPAWGVASSNIAQALFGNPDRAAAYDSDVAQTELLNQKTADLRHGATSRNALQAAIMGFDPRNPDNAALVPKLYSDALGVGDINDASNLAKVMLGITANMGGTDDQIIHSQAGAGLTIGKDDAVSLPGQDAIRTGNFAQDTAIKNSELANALLMNNADNVQLGINNTADNARALEERRMQELGLDHRMVVNTAPGAVSTLAPGNPIGPTTIQGNPTVDTVKGGVAQAMMNGQPVPPAAQAMLLPPVNTPAGNITSGVPGDPRIPSGSMEGLPTADTQKGAIISNAVGAGFGLDPDEVLNPSSGLAAAMGVHGKPMNWAAPNGHKGITYDGVTDVGGAPLPEGAQIQGNTGSQAKTSYVTNDQGVRVEDGPGVHVGLPGGKPNTPHNYRLPDGKIVLSTDGQTDLASKQPLPPGTVQVGSMPASPTEYQSKAVLYANAYTSAMDEITKLPPDFDPTNAVMHVMGDATVPFTANSLAAKFQDPHQQRYMRAVAELAAVTLRGDSGAAINADEFSRYEKIYFPQIGEEDLVKNDKWRALNDRKQSYITASGGFYQLAQDRIKQNPVGAWGSASPAAVPQGAIDMLKGNPGLAAEFDKKYGAGASQQYIGGQ